MKKSFVFLLIMIVSLTAVWAEGKKEAVAGAPVTIEVVTLGFGTAPRDLQMVIDEINEYTLAEINTVINLTSISTSAYKEQLTLMMAGQEPIDLILTGTNFMFDYTNQIDRGQLLPLNDLIEEYGQDIKSVLGDYVKAPSHKGNIYAVTPMAGNLINGTGLYFVHDMVEKYDFDLSTIDSFDDLTPMLEIVQKNEPNVIAFTGGRGPNSADDFTNPYDELGIDIGVALMDIKSPVVTSMFENPVYQAACEQLRDWYLKGYMLSDAATSSLTAAELIRANRGFSFLGQPGEALEYEALAGTKLDLVTLFDVCATADSLLKFLWAVPSHSENPEAAIKFLNLMFKSEKLVNLLQWGIEGKHYVKNADGSIGYPDGIDQKTVGFQLNSGFLWGDQFKQYTFEGKPLTYSDDLKAMVESAVISVGINFVLDPSSIKTELALCDNIMGEYRKALECGAIDSKVEIPIMMKKLRAAGYDKVIAEVQSQLNYAIQ